MYNLVNATGVHSFFSHANWLTILEIGKSNNETNSQKNRGEAFFHSNARAKEKNLRQTERLLNILEMDINLVLCEFIVVFDFSVLAVCNVRRCDREHPSCIDCCWFFFLFTGLRAKKLFLFFPRSSCRFSFICFSEWPEFSTLVFDSICEKIVSDILSDCLAK